jgi:membrane-associated protease RseP (regulator of RpoE activity)
MISNAVNALLMVLVTLLPVSGGSARSGQDSKDEKIVEDRVVVVNEGDDDVETDGGDPIVIRVGRGGFLGVRLVGITGELRTHYGASKDAGVLVGEVESGSPAERAGIEVGDVITSVDGRSVDSTRDVSRAVGRKKGGETVEVELVRGRSPRKVTVTLDERKSRERTIDLGDLPDGMRGRAWAWKDGDFKFRVPHFRVENLDELPSLRERLEDLEKRLRELEKRLPAR